jgi:hypothetical protein
MSSVSLQENSNLSSCVPLCHEQLQIGAREIPNNFPFRRGLSGDRLQNFDAAFQGDSVTGKAYEPRIMNLMLAASATMMLRSQVPTCS